MDVEISFSSERWREVEGRGEVGRGGWGGGWYGGGKEEGDVGNGEGREIGWEEVMGRNRGKSRRRKRRGEVVGWG